MDNRAGEYFLILHLLQFITRCLTAMESNYDLLLQKIDAFIRKYYTDRVIRGTLYALAIGLSYFIIVLALEYFSWFGKATRAALFFSTLLLSFVVVTFFIVIPLLRLAHLGKLISREQASVLIGRHFGGVKDALLNTLQLHSPDTVGNAELISASIDQKAKQLISFPFTEAVDLRKNRKVLRWAAPPLVILLAALLISPSFITKPYQRIVHYNKVYERPAPFSVKVLNDKLVAIQQSDFTIKVEVNGDEVPDQLLIRSGSTLSKMDKKDVRHFEYQWRNLMANIPFNFETDQYQSIEYEIKVLPKPAITSFDVQLTYPAYTGKANETLENTGDLSVPAGTTVVWKFFTRDASTLRFSLGGKSMLLESRGSNAFTYAARMMASAQYSVSASNSYFHSNDSMPYHILVAPDLYPSITVEQFRDSVYDNRLYFTGAIKDDYGFKMLKFRYRKITKSVHANEGPYSELPVNINAQPVQQSFNYFFDVSTLALQAGEEIEYFFEVWDNDGVNGSKSSRSSNYRFKVPTAEELEKEYQSKNESVKDKMEAIIKDSKKLQKQTDDLKKKLVDNKDAGWQEKQTLQQMLEKQMGLQERVKEVAKENEEKSKVGEKYQELSPEALDKQKQLQELFDKVLPDELKKMYEELEKMLDNMDKDKINDMLEKIGNDTKMLEKSIDRNLELFKQLEFQKQFDNNIQQLNKLADEQEKLAAESEKAGKEQSQELKEKQQELNKEFDQFRDDMDQLKKLNQELEQPNDLKSTENEEKQIQDDMQKSADQLDQGEPQNAKQSQSKSAKGMKKLSEELQQMQLDMESEANTEDEATLRQILHNLVTISFDQENLLSKVSKISTIDPKYVKIIQEQKNLDDDLKVVADSLEALSKRQPDVQAFVMRELNKAQSNVTDAIKQLNDRNLAVAQSKQQYAMTAINNLAVMLSDVLKDMKQNVQGKGSGKKSSKCNKPGAGPGKMKSIRQLQEQLNNQLQKMRESMNKPGEQQKPGSSRMSEQFARMAAQQQELRRRLQEMGSEMQKQGTGMDAGLKEALQKMEQTETELVNKKVTQETINRQQEILTRMLESERAEQQRDQDEKRESRQGVDQPNAPDDRFKEYLRLKMKEKELFRTTPPTLSPFYKNKVSGYFLSTEQAK